MLELDPRGPGVERGGADVDLGMQRRIELPLRIELPGQHDAPLVLPRQDPAPEALDAVDAALEPAATGARLDHDRGAIGLADVVRRHRLSMRAVKTSNPIAIGAATVTDLRTTTLASGATELISYPSVAVRDGRVPRLRPVP